MKKIPSKFSHSLLSFLLLVFTLFLLSFLLHLLYSSNPVFNHAQPVFGDDRLGVELHADDVELVVLNAHDGPILRPRGNGQAVWHRLLLDAQAVVPRCVERVVHVLEQPFAVVEDWAAFAVHKSRGRSHDVPSKRLSYALVSHAHAEDRYSVFGREHLRHLEADSAILRSSRSRTDDDAVRFTCGDFRDGDLIVFDDVDETS